MTGTRRAGGPVLWLTGQAVAFGVMAALLGIVANTLFLDAYGADWLPATYIAIGIAGVLVSGAVASSARSAEVIRIALVVLGCATVLLALAWTIAALGGSAWVSVPLLVLFPILIQLGFVFIGAQAGRLLDIAGIKASFPRIVAGFPAGAVLGGLLGGWLVAWSGRTEDLLLATAIAQGLFAALVWATGRRYSSRLAPTVGGSPAASAGLDDSTPTQSLRQLLGQPFVRLILAYQVLSALASQLADFLVFDRAAAQFPNSADLAGYLAAYTAVMNVVSIAFLFAIAGPLLQRFGLRFGITANPLVLTVFAAAMVAVDAAAGAGSVALLAIVSAARIADVALTDGTTRTSINAAYQVLHERTRLAVQAAVEGVGVPVAIGLSGILILAIQALPSDLEVTIVVTTITCLVWTYSSVSLYRAYGPALVDALRRRRWLDLDAALEATAADVEAARMLLSDTDPRAVRLAFDVLSQTATPSLVSDLASLVHDPRPDVRMTALAGSAILGNEAARQRLAAEVGATAASPDPATRLRAARSLEALAPADREAAAHLLTDVDPAVRGAALEAVRPGDRFAVDQVIEALGDPHTLGAAAGAVSRLGDSVVAPLAERLTAATRVPVSPLLLRLVRATAPTSSRDEVLARHVAHPDRELGLAVMERLVGSGPAPAALAIALGDVLTGDARHAARIAAVQVALDGEGMRHDRDPVDVNESPGADVPLRRALQDEWDVVRQRVATGVLARHGSTRLAPVLVGLSVDGPDAALAAEALGVMLDSAERELVMPVLEPGRPPGGRLSRLPPPEPTAPGAGRDVQPADIAGWLRDLVEDRGAQWRSSWLRACAIHAAAARGILGQMDLATARALADPVVDEELDQASPR